MKSVLDKTEKYKIEDLIITYAIQYDVNTLKTLMLYKNKDSFKIMAPIQLHSNIGVKDLYFIKDAIIIEKQDATIIKIDRNDIAQDTKHITQIFNEKQLAQTLDFILYLLPKEQRNKLVLNIRYIPVTDKIITYVYTRTNGYYFDLKNKSLHQIIQSHNFGMLYANEDKTVFLPFFAKKKITFDFNDVKMSDASNGKINFYTNFIDYEYLYNLQRNKLKKSGLL